MRISSRGHVDPFIVMDVMAAAHAREAAGHRIIHMEIGQPGTGAPAGATAAVAAAMATGAMGYTPALGLPALRAGIADLYRRWYGIALNPERVVVTAGSSGAFLLAFTALFDAGDKVAIGVPGYPSYRHILKALSLTPVGLPTRVENRLQPVAADVPRGVAGMIVASPGNPTGTMLTRGALMGLMHVAAERDMAFVSDEIYHGLHYGARAVTALEISDDCFVVNSFSKYFSMTGWRVGWMVVPETHVRAVERLAQNMFICAPHAAQVAALAALDCEAELEGNRAVYARNRAAMLAGLPGAGLTRFAPPDGAFYVYVDVSDVTKDSVAFCAEVLEHAGVAITPGVDFDADRGRQSVRLSYAGRNEDIVEGVARLKDFMGRR